MRQINFVNLRAEKVRQIYSYIKSLNANSSFFWQNRLTR